MIEMTTALIIFLFPLAYSPGPGNMFFAANGARFGVRATWPANFGYHIATWTVTLAVGFGFAVVIEQFPKFFVIIKYAGSAYVFYLAVKFFRAGALENAEDARPASFMDGVILMVVNPKAYVIIALMFTQFLKTAQIEYTIAVLWISTIFTLNNLLAFLLWIIVGDRIAVRFRDETNSRRINMGFGIVLIIVALWMIVA